MLIAVVLTSAALAAVILVMRAEARTDARVGPEPPGEWMSGRPAEDAVAVPLPRAVWGYEPQAVRAALSAAVVAASTPVPTDDGPPPGDSADDSPGSDPDVGEEAPASHETSGDEHQQTPPATAAVVGPAGQTTTDGAASGHTAPDEAVPDRAVREARR